MHKIIAVISGLLFGFGLALSGMTDTANVIGFLDLFGDWNPQLLVVMGAAVITTLISFRFVLGQNKPVFAAEFHLPKKTKLDKQIILGASIFGLGWGLYGYCPGPAIASLGYLEPATGVFVISMIAGMFIANKLLSWIE